MTTFQELAQRIKSAASREALAAMDDRITKHYHAGTITTKELMKLDTLAMETLAKIED